MTNKSIITKIASDEQVCKALEAEHIKPNELTRLVDYMLGQKPYEPRTDGSGQTLRCKAAGCSNLALGSVRKQLCPTHCVRFLERRSSL